MFEGLKPSTIRCFSCGSENLHFFYEIRQIPVHNVLLMPSRQEALTYPKGDLTLAFCQDCGFIFNAAFDPGTNEYSERYEETQGFSPTFNKFHRKLAQSLVEKYDLRKKNIIEIGCGKGEFLSLLCEIGENEGIGFDPAFIESRRPPTHKGKVTFIRDYYSEKYAHFQADFYVCKMTLEHIQETGAFVELLRKVIGNNLNSTVFFQVPNAAYVLESLAFWDIYYEHCSYFTKESLIHLFRTKGFTILDLYFDYNNQYLMLEARPTANVSKQSNKLSELDLSEMKKLVNQFEEKVVRSIAYWKQEIKQAAKAGEKIVLWGGGSKGVAFLTTLNILSEIQYVVDINPYKHGTFMAGTGQEIVSPEFLATYSPDKVIVMNPIYRDEIHQQLNELDVHAKLMTV